LRIAGDEVNPPLELPGQLFLWPGAQSYTRQPSAEFHTFGSPPLLAAALDELARRGVRAAEPGEFTLRAFLAGRIDLAQAEAVLGVVEATSREDLDGALEQLAGGLTRPLHDLRERLLSVLAELEAGLDFADEPIEFIARDELSSRIADGQRVVAATLAQLAERERVTEAPRVVLAGPANVGKSSLFNALVARYLTTDSVRSIVSPAPGATRDYVSALISLEGLTCELIDVAGEVVDDAGGMDPIHEAAQRTAGTQQRAADIILRCRTATERPQPALRNAGGLGEIIVATKADLATEARLPDSLSCSSVTGAGLAALGAEIRRRLTRLTPVTAGYAATTAARCSGSLREAQRALAAAGSLSESGGDELLAAEIRSALDAIGDVVGAVAAEDVLSRVFSQFCIGK
jgi:tRNA modification GTPase